MLKQTIAQLKKQISDFEIRNDFTMSYPISGIIIHNTKEAELDIEVFNLEDAVKSKVPKGLNVTAFINTTEAPITFCNFGDKSQMLLFGNLNKELEPIMLGRVLTSFYK